MQTTQIEKSKTHILTEIIEYVRNSVVSKTMIHKTTGNINVMAIDTGETQAEKISPFDTFFQIIEDDPEGTTRSLMACPQPAHELAMFLRDSVRIPLSLLSLLGIKKKRDFTFQKSLTNLVATFMYSDQKITYVPCVIFQFVQR